MLSRAVGGLLLFACLALAGCSDTPSAAPGSGLPSSPQTPTSAAKTAAGQATAKETSTSSDAAGPDSVEAPAWPGPKDAPPALLDADRLNDGWIALFDGLTLFGWRPQGDQNWRVEDGTIVVDAGSKPALLCTAVRFRDYELHVEFRADAATNSGVFLRTPKSPTNPAADCYELNIAPPDNPFPTGSLVGRQKVELPNAAELADGVAWRRFDITVQGDQVQVSLDGQRILEHTATPAPKVGYIGLQHNQGKVAFRNVWLKPLSLRPLFNGQDLTGWRAPDDQASRFTVTSNGELHVEGGSGYLESEETFGDFILQLQCITHAPKLNSGVFFRCIPGEKMNGYESQIQNGFADGDRTRPDDFGTGAIFRRRKARLVAADDQVWFSQTIVADGPTLDVWVNGLAVTDWEDTRPPDANPRKGLRLTPGSLMLQGHDPTTDLSFRRLRIDAW